MTIIERKQSAQRAKNRSVIESIGMSLERFNASLSDDRKVRLFSMNHTDLKQLATDVDSARTGLKAISYIVAAISTSEQERRQNEEVSTIPLVKPPRKAK